MKFILSMCFHHLSYFGVFGRLCFVSATFSEYLYLYVSQRGNLTFNSDAAPNYKHMFGPLTIFLLHK